MKIENTEKVILTEKEVETWAELVALLIMMVIHLKDKNKKRPAEKALAALNELWNEIQE